MEHGEMHLHPLLVHFPIALLTGALMMEILSLILKKDSWHRTALHMYIFAAAMAPLTVWTGWEEAEHEHLKHAVLTLHRNFALVTMWTALLSLPILRLVYQRLSQYFRVLFLAFLIGTAVCVGITGYHGGRLVYEYGVGVEEGDHPVHHTGIR